jgi:hypothetical protein
MSLKIFFAGGPFPGKKDYENLTAFVKLVKENYLVCNKKQKSTIPFWLIAG